MGRVVKGHGHVVPGALIDAREQADAILDVARRKAAIIVLEAENERERLCQEALERGRAQAVVDVAGLLAAGRAEADAMLARAAPDALAIAAKMAEKIVGRAVALDPDVMAEIAGEALAACRTRAGAVVLRVHPDCLEGLERNRAKLAARLGGEASLALVADGSLGRLGCVVETPVGRVDARLPTLLKQLIDTARGEGDAE